ncbi:MAG: hypothetical protein LBH20_08355 [Treponema sp.]|jgi:hypothetical protein|nr:hypothetical protein [Treponema sp.]
MGDLIDTGTSGNDSGWKKWTRRWIFEDFVKKGVWAALLLSLLIFIVYMAGSMPDPGFSDGLLFLLLRLLQYASLLLGVFALFALGFSVRRLVYHPCLRNALGLCFYFFVGILGAGFAMINSVIIAASGGNG